MNNKIAIIGIGGAGAKTISRIKERINITSIIIDAEDDGITADESIILNQNMDNQKNTNTEIIKLNSVISMYDIIILCVGLGGETGTAVAPIFTELAKKQNKIVVAVLYKPFNFEGSIRNRIAENSTAKICETATISVEISNDMIAKVSPKRTSFSQAFSADDNLICEIIEIITNEVNNDDFKTAKDTIINRIEEATSKSVLIIK